jgi:hypothetical protein
VAAAEPVGSGGDGAVPEPAIAAGPEEPAGCAGGAAAAAPVAAGTAAGAPGTAAGAPGLALAEPAAPGAPGSRSSRIENQAMLAPTAAAMTTIASSVSVKRDPRRGVR